MACNLALFMFPIWCILSTAATTRAFSISRIHARSFYSVCAAFQSSSNEKSRTESSVDLLDPEVAGQFKIIACSSTACAKRCRDFGLDDYALFSGIYQRKEGSKTTHNVEVSEGSCMGRCKFGPCVGVEHEEYDGRVGLEGMTDQEFHYRTFQK